MYKTILILLVAFLAVVNCQWEGIWSDGTYNASVCLEGSSLHIRAETYFAYGTVDATDSTLASGKYFSVGDKYTGVRASYANFYGARGKHVLVYNATADTITGTFYLKGGAGFITSTLTFTRVSTSVGVTGDARILACAIIDTTSTATANGYWLSNDSSAITMHICVTGTKFTASYSFNFNYDKSDSILPGYWVGYCAMKGQICGGVYYQNDVDYTTYTTFGAETAVRLSTDQLLLVHTRGAPGVIGFFSSKKNNIGVNYLDRQSASTTECAAYAAEKFNPVKCITFDKDFCSAVEGLGFCEVSNGNCVRSEWSL